MKYRRTRTTRTAKIVIGLAAAATAIVSQTQHAEAATTDSVAWGKALTLCQTVKAYGPHEECVVGATVNATGRVLTGDDYHMSKTGLVLDHATRPITSTVSKPTTADRARMVTANAECKSVPNHTVKWSACITGSANANGGDTAFVTSADWFAIRVRQHVGYTWKAYAVHHAHALVTPLP